MRSIAYYWKEGLRNIFKHGMEGPYSRCAQP